MNEVNVQRLTCARIPTEQAEFQLCFYQNNVDQKEHLALLLGELLMVEEDDARPSPPQPPPLVRIHSECFTGDVLGSLRCDCGTQLQQAMQEIAIAGEGVVLYLRQEGRGIGLLEKLRAYNLQDDGLDTVDANLRLGHQADARDYTIAARILQDLGLTRIRLLTNNPEKVEALTASGIDVVERITLQGPVQQENAAYLETKVNKMRHLLDLQNGSEPEQGRLELAAAVKPGRRRDRPFVTLSYAQGIDGAITRQPGTTLALSGQPSLRMTHQLRANHEAILVGLNTVIADDPRLTVRLATGPDPQPVVLDSHLRFPLDRLLLQNKDNPVWIAATPAADVTRAVRLEEQGARILMVPADGDGRVSLPDLLPLLHDLGIHSLMVEGGAAVITSFLRTRLVDRMIITIAPRVLGGLSGVGSLPVDVQPVLSRMHHLQLGEDLILYGNVRFGGQTT